MSDEPLPCPCCDSREAGARADGLYYWIVRCMDCGLRTDRWLGEEEAVRRWNRRPGTAESLEVACERCRGNGYEPIRFGQPVSRCTRCGGTGIAGTTISPRT